MNRADGFDQPSYRISADGGAGVEKRQGYLLRYFGSGAFVYKVG
ncbi:hypothetical protein ACNQR9_16185 [Mycolicibacterium peregrinum]